MQSLPIPTETKTSSVTAAEDLERRNRDSYRNAPTLVIETTTPIRSSGNPNGVIALVIGLVLALHTPAWVLLVIYKEEVWSTESESGSDADSTTATPGSALNIYLLQFFSRYLLDFTPWFANAMLSIFVGVLFVCMGRAMIEVPGSETP